jgi:hypothetical protein
VCAIAWRRQPYPSTYSHKTKIHFPKRQFNGRRQAAYLSSKRSVGRKSSFRRFVWEAPMKAFTVGIVVAAMIALGAAIGLSFIQKTSAEAYSSGAVRLDQQESVNFYGR